MANTDTIIIYDYQAKFMILTRQVDCMESLVNGILNTVHKMWYNCECILINIEHGGSD